MIEMIPSTMANLCRTLLLAHELYYCIPIIPNMKIIAASSKLRMKHIKKNNLGKF